MYLTEQIKNNSLLALISGSFILQVFILLTALLYRYNSNNELSILPNTAVKLVASDDTSSVKNKNINLIENKPATNTDNIAQDSASNEVYKISSGDTLSKIWSKFTNLSSGGIKAAEAFRAVNIPVNSLRPGVEVSLTISPQKDITEFSMKLPEGKSIILKGDSINGYKSEIKTEKIIVKERTVSYPIFDTFSESAQEVNVPVDIIDDLVDLFSNRIDFRRDMQPGDSFTVIYDERITESGERLSPGRIKAISIETGGKLLVAIQHSGKDGVVRYFNENGELLGDNFLKYPLKFSRISSVFTTSRFHPILKVSRPHNGVDFSAPTGTPVRTIGDGVVDYVGYGKETGNMIKVKHNEKYSTAYMHLSKIAPFIKKGTHVSRGEVIGNVGMTGLATAPHLHYSLYENNKFVNPLTTELPVLSAKDNSIPKTILAGTMDILKQQHELIRIASLVGFNKAA